MNAWVRINQRMIAHPILKSIAPHLTEYFWGWIPGRVLERAIVKFQHANKLVQYLNDLGLSVHGDLHAAFPLASLRSLRLVLEHLGFPQPLTDEFITFSGPVLHTPYWQGR